MKKVRTLIDCVGLGYDLKKGDETELKPDLAKTLINFGYVEEIEIDEKSESNEDEKTAEEVKPAKEKSKGKNKEKSDK